MPRSPKREMVLAALSLSLSLWLGLVAASSGDEAREAEGDLKPLQGTWASSDEKDSRWTFEGRTLRATVAGTDYVCKVTPDAKASPQRLDFFVSEAPGESAGKTALAIYKFDGDRLIICVGLPGDGRRPGDFKEVEGEAFVYELKRPG